MDTETQLVETKPTKRKGSETTALAPQSLTPAQMLSVAVQQNADTAKLEKLMDLQERWEKNEARKAYIQAMTVFRAKCPTINHTRQGHNGTYAGLPETVEQILPLLADCQLAVTWQITKDEAQWITVQCRVSHIGGHCEETSLGGPPDTSGNKNLLQARNSTWSYLRRVTLFSLLGLVDKAEVDDDGAGGKPPVPPKPASESALGDPEQETKRQFLAACRKKLGDPKLSTAVVGKLFTAAQQACGSEEAARCLEYIQQDDVILGKDGTISIATEPEPGYDPPAPDDSEWSLECDECRRPYKVLPAGGKCQGQPDGSRCFGHVVLRQ